MKKYFCGIIFLFSNQIFYGLEIRIRNLGIDFVILCLSLVTFLLFYLLNNNSEGKLTVTSTESMT